MSVLSSCLLGRTLSAMAVYLSVFQHIPVERAQFLIVDLTGGVVSAGLVHSCLGKAAGLVTDVVRLIRTLIAAAPVAGFDETTLRSEPAGTRSTSTARSPSCTRPRAWSPGCGYRGRRRPGSCRPSPGSWAGHDSDSWQRFAGHQAAPPHHPRLRLLRRDLPRRRLAGAWPSTPCAASSVPGTPPGSRDFPPPAKSATAGDRVPPRPARRGAGSMLRRVR